MRRDRMDRRCLAGMERGLSSRLYVAELHAQGLSQDAAVESVIQAFGVSRGAARLYIRSHPTWASEAPVEGPRGTEVIRS